MFFNRIIVPRLEHKHNVFTLVWVITKIIIDINVKKTYRSGDQCS